MATAVLSLIGFLVVAVAADVLVRSKIEQDVYRNTQRVATEWIGSMGTADPPPVTTSDVNLLQLVDASGRVVAASRAAAGRPPLSKLWPPSDDRIQNGIACSAGECVMFTASRPSPQEEELLWGGASHVVYAGMTQPAILGTRRLEWFLAAGVLAATALMTWVASFLIRRTLQPVEAMRARIAEITVTDLGLRVPAPPGRDAIAQLARTANQTLARLQEAVEQQRRFSSMVSHELRTPITGLRTQLEEALMYPEVDARAAIRGALSTLDRVQTIIEEMLTLARIRTSCPHQPERVDLSSVVREEVANRRNGPPVRLHIDEDLKVRGNSVQLGEVLTNLLVNAQRHAHACVEVSVERSNGHAVVSVLDDGEGVPPQDREQVFEPFVRLSGGRERDPQGSGLGLAISRAIAQAHQGSLGIEDSPRGARFVLRLPLVE
ncbi:sensor histidine kinase [Nonomuraea sp. SYSU D8015]|uniref:sensor histidine kinase n=1 Tax=Nonomuraea sp. SYSU D8015 TaxID=2593644 RepID=UPI0016612504|nr:HAMP domain-containing sensor histidine kinase [Nonomuraea sp. SYSU D8015]